MSAAATILIVTKDRRDDTRKAVASAFAQTVPVEVIVIDDASADGTSDMVRTEYPHARLHRVEVSQGYIGHRNRGAEMATTPIVVTIDDDTVLEARDTIATTIAEFDRPCIGAVAIPFIEPRVNPDLVRQRAPDANHVWVSHRFIGAAHALRRDVFLRIGGFREELKHFGEEVDFCGRLLQAGYVTRLGNASPAYHYLSPRRSRPRERYFAARNSIFSAWLNYPLRFAVPALPFLGAREIAYAFKYRMPLATMRGIASGYGNSMLHLRRQPLSVPAFRALRLLKASGAMTLEEIQHHIPLAQE